MERARDCRNGETENSKDYNSNTLEFIFMHMNNGILLNNNLSPNNDSVMLDILK